MNLHIRPEREEDHAVVQRVNEEAFGGQTEAKLVNRLRVHSRFLSLVAESDGEIVGHILFTPVTLDDEDRGIMGLAPMAVLPGQQGKGIGSALIETGLQACREADASAVIVLGHADYYPRFGFVPASRFGVSSEYDVPDENFMALELRPGALAGGGLIRYHHVFNDI